MHWIFYLSLFSPMAVLQTHLTWDPAVIHLDGRYHCYHVLCYTKLLCNLKPHNATCPKGVPSWLIKEIAEVASEVTLIMQASLDLGRIHFSWKRHWSSRYFRKGNRSAKSSNHPISLTTILCKMCEHIVHCAVIGHLSEHGTLTDSQHGFRKISCDTQFIRTIHDLVSGSEEKEHTNPILLDFAKAFDKVTSCLLQHQIEYYGIRCYTLYKVKVTFSHFWHSARKCHCGPLRFLVFINDLPASVRHSIRRRKKYTSGPRYWNVPVLVNTGTFLVYQNCPK